MKHTLNESFFWSQGCMANAITRITMIINTKPTVVRAPVSILNKSSSNTSSKTSIVIRKTPRKNTLISWQNT